MEQMYKKLKLTTISELIKNIYCSLSVLIIGCASAYAVEFNKDLIEAEDRENVNLSQFETDGQLPVGKYSLNALINNKRTPIHLDLQWVLIDNQTAVCLTPEQLTLVRLFAGFCQAFGNCTGRTVLRIARIDIPLAAISGFEIENLLRI